MKIGIYTIHSAYNFGAMFQSYATQKAIEKIGFEAEIVNLYPLKEEKNNELRVFDLEPKAMFTYCYAKLNPNIILKLKRFKNFHLSMNLSKRYFSVDEIIKTPPIYDIHLVGSDQVWNLEKGIESSLYFFLNFLKSDSIKISYGSSFGTSMVDEKHYISLKQLLTSFKAIGVRENEGVEIVKAATGFTSKQVLDPTFLLTQEEWGNLASERIINEDYILYYGFDNTEISKKIISNLKKRLGLIVVAVSGSVFFPHKVDKFIQNAGPKEFLSLVKYSKFVIASSFHGVAFAIHFKKSFVSIKHPTRNSRMESLLKNLNLINRQIENPDVLLELSERDFFIDYNDLNEEIKHQISESISWLSNSLIKSFKD